MAKFLRALKLRKDDEVSTNSRQESSSPSGSSSSGRSRKEQERSPPSHLTRSPIIIRRNNLQEERSVTGGREEGQHRYEDSEGRSVIGRGKEWDGQQRYGEREKRLIGGSERLIVVPPSVQACPLPSPVSNRRQKPPCDAKAGSSNPPFQSADNTHGFLLPSLPTSTLQQSSSAQPEDKDIQSDGKVVEMSHGRSVDIPAKMPFVNGREDGGDIRSRRHSHDNKSTHDHRPALAPSNRLQSPLLSPRHSTARNEHLYSEFRPDLESISDLSNGGGSSSSAVAALYPLPQPPVSPRVSLSNAVPTPRSPRRLNNLSLIPPLSPRAASVLTSVSAPQPPLSSSSLTHNVAMTPPLSPRNINSSAAPPLSPLKIRTSATPPLSPRGSIPQSPRKGDIDTPTRKWVKGSLIGSGAFGRVYKGIHSETGELCAIKEVEFVRGDTKSLDSAKQLAQEIAFLSSFSHPHIVQYRGSELVGDSLYIYLELISGGSLYKLLSEFKRLEEPVIKRYTRQILLGLQFLHNRNTVHRDIKCANILVDQGGIVKLADFGLAKYVKEQGIPFSIKGSPLWMAPEVIMQKNTGYEYAVDIWSLGCTVIEMATGKPPFSEFEPVVAMFKVTRETPHIPESLSPDAQSFVELCLKKNPAERPSASELLSHPFLQIESSRTENVTHAFAALEALDIDIEPIPSISGKQPSLSAPSSPRTSNEVFSTLYPTRSTGFLTPPRGTAEGSKFDKFDDGQTSRRQRKSNHH